MTAVQSSSTTTGTGPARRRGTPAGIAVVTRRIGPPLVVLALILFGWTIAARVYDIPLLLPGPAPTLTGLREALMSGDLIDAVLASLRRIATGFVIGVSLGTILGLLAGRSRIIWGLLEPLVNFFRFIPPLAWFAPALLLFGAGEKAQIALIVYTTVFVVIVNTMAGVNAVPKQKTRMAETFGASRSVILVRVVLPVSLPYVFTGMRIALGNAFMTVVTAEMLGADTGLGVRINNGMTTLDMVSVLGAIFTLGILGFSSDLAFGALSRAVQRRYGNG